MAKLRAVSNQASVLGLVFKIADDQGLLLLDLKDLRAILSFIAENAQELMNVDNVDGALVGGASLDAEEFTLICRFREHPGG